MRYFLAVLLCLGVFQTTHATAEGRPVVVELFTSQGCSACPPADAMLQELAQRDDVIALALHVDYWDYIGWKDVFGRPEHTARQQAYAHAANAETIYTPQMIIGGVDHVIGSRPMQVMDAVQAHELRGSLVDVVLTRNGDRVAIAATPTVGGDYLVQLVRYTPSATVEISKGENAGHRLTYTNIVTSWDVISRWDGRMALQIDAEAAGADPVVVIVQKATHGPIIGAAALR